MATHIATRGRRRSERSHEAIIAATQQLLVERSYPEVTIEGIAARAGVGKQTIYRWWPSKAALVLEAYLAGQDAVPPPAEGKVAREDVRALLGWLIAVLAQPIGGRDVVPARREPMLAALERARARGEIRADADLELAVDSLHGAVFYRLLLSGEPLDAEFADRLAEQTLKGLAAC